ncbi:AAA family ATPase [bacterium]|nr:AAA family ATPase [bacterium]
MQILNKPNFYIFSGGPGAGKTTVLNELSKKNYRCIPEVARAIIKEQRAIGGNALHTGDRTEYVNLMLKNSIHDFMMQSFRNDVCFFDRGIPDLYSYLSQYYGSVTATIEDAIKHYRYNTLVFLFPPWPEIYCHDTERKLDLKEAIKTYHSVKDAYRICGYETIDVPMFSVTKRIDFILQTIKTTK